MLLFTISCLWTWAALHYRASQSWFADPKPTLLHYLLFVAVFALEAPIQLLHWLHGFWGWLPYHLPVVITSSVAAAMLKSIQRWSKTNTKLAAASVLGLYGTLRFFWRAHTLWVWILNPFLLLLLLLAWMLTASVCAGTLLPEAKGPSAIAFIGVSSLAHILWAERTHTVDVRFQDSERWTWTQWMDPLLSASTIWSVVGFH